MITAFSTDGRIPAFDDTRGAFPPYDAVLPIGPGVAARRPGLRRALEPLQDAIDGDAMRFANKHVDVEDGSVAEAADLLRRRIRKPPD